MKSKMILLALLLVVFPSLTFAQEEEITLTTYYPSPYGNYKEMDVHHLNIASNSNEYGTINFSGVVSDSVPTSGTNGVSEGSLYYNRSTHNYRFLDQNGDWQTFGGPAGTIFSLIYCPRVNVNQCLAVPTGGQLDGTITGAETCQKKCEAQGGVCVSGFPYAISSQYATPPTSTMGAVPEAPFDCDARGDKLTAWNWGIGCRCLK